jgi:hypothetical protein
MVFRGKVTVWTAAALTIGIWVGYREMKAQFGPDEANSALYFIFGYIVFFGVLGLLCEWADSRRRRKRRERDIAEFLKKFADGNPPSGRNTSSSLSRATDFFNGHGS